MGWWGRPRVRHVYLHPGGRGDWLGAGAYGEPGVVAPLTAGTSRPGTWIPPPPGALYCLDKPPGPSCTLDRPATCRPFILRTNVLVSS